MTGDLRYALAPVLALGIGANVFGAQARTGRLFNANEDQVAVRPAAIFVPLRRATRVDCTVALREE